MSLQMHMKIRYLKEKRGWRDRDETDQSKRKRCEKSALTGGEGVSIQG